MGSNKKFLPFVRQLIVTLSVGLGMMEQTLLIGFTTILLPQLRDDPDIIMDDISASWIASILGPSNILGTFIGYIIVKNFGRRLANLTSASTVVIGWILVFYSTTATMMLTARFVQGFAVGISCISGTVVVGEYATPKYRGAFLAIVASSFVAGFLIVHAVGSSFTWHKTALICLCIAITDTVLLLFSPETPVFLASVGKYDECRKVFHWLRGFDEEYELNKMIRTAEIKKAMEMPTDNQGFFIKSKRRIWQTLSNAAKSQFYKPMILVTHLGAGLVWCGSALVEIYAVDVSRVLIGKEVNFFLLLLTMDITKSISSALGVYLNTKFKRRTVIKWTYGFTILVLFLTAAYCYAKDFQLLKFDHPLIGASLMCLIELFTTMGPISMPSVIYGEIFPLEYKSACAMINSWISSLNFTICLTLIPYMVIYLKLSGSFCVCAGITIIVTAVVLYLLPETKDLILQDIEERYWTKPVPDQTFMPEIRELQELKQ